MANSGESSAFTEAAVPLQSLPGTGVSASIGKDYKLSFTLDEEVKKEHKSGSWVGGGGTLLFVNGKEAPL